MGDNRKLIILSFKDRQTSRTLSILNERLKDNYGDYRFLLLNGDISVIDPEKDGNLTIAKVDGYTFTVEDIIKLIDDKLQKEDQLCQV